MGNDADAADATQEAMISLVRGLAGFDGRSRFSTWSYRIAVNASLDELRRRKRRPVVSLDDSERGGGHDGGGPAAAGLDASDQVERLAIDAALRRLPLEFRAAVVLRDLCGLDYAEIGEVLGIPPGTVRSRIARGRSALVPLLSLSADGNPSALPDRPSEQR